MAKRMVAMATLLVLALSISVQAAEPHVIRNNPSLTFSGTTAICSVDCKSGNSSDQISATLTLYQGSTYVDSWSSSGNGRVLISKSCPAKSGKEYKLVLSYSVNGQAQSPVSVTNTCP
jgi:hypothetical protein